MKAVILWRASWLRIPLRSMSVSQRELFVDHHLIEKLEGARLVLHHPVAREEAIRFDPPWEGNTSVDWVSP
tara:strand:- start:142 stop:354 length:213 start_codon:yes stop_codon:yes gene_type:complete